MSPKIVLWLAIVFAAAQCEAIRVQELKVNEILHKFTNWVKNKEDQIKRRIENAAEGLKRLGNTLLKDAQEMLQESVVHIEKDLATWKAHLPEKCITPVKARLENLKTASASEFSKCSNLTIAADDLGKILSQIGDVTITVLKFCNTILEGVEECIPYVTLSGVKCINSYVIQAMHQFKEDIPRLKQYFVDIANTGKDLRAQVETCLHPSKAKLEGQLTTLMASLSSCAK